MSSLIRHPDNSPRLYTQSEVERLRPILGRSVEALCREFPNLLLFPARLEDALDDVGLRQILRYGEQQGEEQYLHTGNLMGFVGVGDVSLTICSRFAQTDCADYFLHYLLQRVFSLNLFDLAHSSDRTSLFDLLLYLFPTYLKNALKQGLFSQYRTRSTNECRVQGAIDVARHLGQNSPFMGRVACRVRERSTDNYLMQLIRHTIELIRRHPMASTLLHTDRIIEEAVAKVVAATPSYAPAQRNFIVGKNLRPVCHPYYRAYAPLQRLCLLLLRHRGLMFGQETSQVCGLLFDGAWLWEEYLARILREVGFDHAENRLRRGGFTLFEEGWRVYPDFYRRGEFILDAKYKALGGAIGREDLFQVMSYMHVEQAPIGGVIHPDKGVDRLTCSSVGHLRGFGGEVRVYRFPVPHEAASWREFCERMACVEEQLKRELKGNP